MGPVLALVLLAGTSAARPAVSRAVDEAVAARASAPVIVKLKPTAEGPEGPRLRRRETLLGALAAPRALRNADVVSGRVDAAGLEALRRRPDVESVTLDRSVRPAGQVGPAQIGADRLVRDGLEGRGRSIAVVDSGIDPLHPDLGGAPIPNEKVWGGWNVSAGDDDVSDCSGHGTAVAGVAAGSDGVAPGAGLVALKVFGDEGGCQTATFSDVLAAVDWAVSNASRLRIDVVNLSLADDTARAGFCDAEEPAAAAVFAAARAAGLAVVAASGNGSHADGLAWPACHSDVAAVGMVYSSSIGATAWGGGSPCEDAVTGPDLVPCASNSGAALSLLAPGVRWQTDAPGGTRVATFSGTSAAAPAAAGALLLARQARAARDPAVSLDLLRLSGVPVVDGRTGRATPRVDLSSAFDAADPVTGPCVVSGSAVDCDGSASGLAGVVSSVTVALTLERADGGELTAELVAPDGTRVRLVRASGAPGEVVRSVFGRTADADEPLSRFAGRTAAGVWRLALSGASAPPRVVSWALAIETGPPVRGDGHAPAALLPAATRGAGRFGAFFTTDVRLFNSDPYAPHDATLRFAPRSGDPELAVSVRIPPSGTRVLDDVLGNAFRAAGAGPLRVDALPAVVATARVRTTAPRGGAFAMPAPVLAPSVAIGAADDGATLVPLLGETGWRVNVGLVEVTGKPADVLVRVRAAAGGTVGSLTASIPGGASVQLNDVFGAVGQPADPGGRIDVEVTGGPGRVLAYATALENATSDGELAVPPAPVRFSAIPIPPVEAGARLDVKLTSSLGEPVRVKLAYAPATGPRPAAVIVPVGRNETRLLEDVLALFGHDASDGGALLVTALDGTTVLVASRLSSASDAAGWSAVPAASGRGLAPGRRLALSFLSGGSSLTMAETAGLDAYARLSVLSAEGDLLRVFSLKVDASQSVSYPDLFAALGIEPPEGVTVVLENVSGGFLSIEALRRDPVTGDALAVSGAPLP